MLKKPKVSIIIVKYKSEEYLSKCLSSIGNSGDYEIIIVDNDKENVGYGAGCNRGAGKAKGKYLFFLNPDTEVFPGAIETLVKFIANNQDVGIVAPILLNEKKVPYPIQITRKLTPLSALVSFSFLNKLFPQNPISKNYWFADWDKRKIQEANMIPGTALMISKELFNKIGGFDENFFLFFEETDLCRRVKQTGGKIFINPNAKIIHYWGKSTLKSPKTKQIFCRSRYYYFRKYWGFIPALLVESFLRGSEWLAEKI